MYQAWGHLLRYLSKTSFLRTSKLSQNSKNIEKYPNLAVSNFRKVRPKTHYDLHQCPSVDPMTSIDQRLGSLPSVERAELFSLGSVTECINISHWVDGGATIAFVFLPISIEVFLP